MHYVGMILYTVLWIAAFAFCVMAVAGGIRRPSIGRLLVTMRIATWFIAGITIFAELWLLANGVFNPDALKYEELSFLQFAIVLAVFHALCWLGFMTICNVRLSFALLRMHHAGEVIAWQREAEQVATWCRRFRAVHRCVCWINDVSLDAVLDSTRVRLPVGQEESAQASLPPNAAQ
jgi:hypothetical protein